MPRDESAIRRDAQMWALVAEMWATKTEVDGMIAENELLKSNGCRPVYDEVSFVPRIRMLDEIARKLREEV